MRKLRRSANAAVAGRRVPASRVSGRTALLLHLVLLIYSHGDSRHSSYDIGFLRKCELPCCYAGIGMRQQKQLISLNLTPPTRESISELQEINWSIERPFRLGRGRLDPALCHVDLDKS